MTHAFILALALLAHTDQVPPELVEPFKTFDECAIEADRLNRTHPAVINADPKLKAEFVCLVIARAPGI